MGLLLFLCAAGGVYLGERLKWQTFMRVLSHPSY
mgnify:FL=1